MDFNQAFDPIRAFGAAWKILKRAPVAILVGGVVVLALTDAEDGYALRDLTQGEVHVQWEDLSAVLWHATIGAFSVLAQVISFVLACFFVTSFAGTVERVLRSGQGQAADLLNARGRFVNQLLASLLGGTLLVLGMLPMWVLQELVEWVGGSIGAPWIAAVSLVVLFVIWMPVIAYIYLGLRFVAQAVALEGLGPVEAIRRSWSLVDGHRWQLVWYLVVVNVFAALGILACGVGVLVTGSIKVTAVNESYLRLITPEADQAGWESPEREESEEPGWRTAPASADSAGDSAAPA